MLKNNYESIIQPHLRCRLEQIYPSGLFWLLGYWYFNFVSDFDIRASKLGSYRWNKALLMIERKRMGGFEVVTGPCS